MMKYKSEIVISFIVTLLVLFLKSINIFQVENGLGQPFILLLLIVCFSLTGIYLQRQIDHNYKNKQLNYQNLDILKYISAVLIMILHLRPFIHLYDPLDLAFNNIITRICVPIFFMITGYFVAKKEKKNENYIYDYIKKTIPLYLIWSLIYIPAIIVMGLQYLPEINTYLASFHLSLLSFILLSILVIPIVIIIALCYTGVYYHLWYFPALICSLFVLKKWKNKFDIKYLLGMSFVLLLFGATETYYGVLPLSIKELISYYYAIFYTTRNFLFFGLFYVVLGYFMGEKEELYTPYCFVKLIITIFFLVFEAILLHDHDRLDSNILISCVPLTYYLFISSIYISRSLKTKFQFGNYSKYYYFIHPMIILMVSILFKNLIDFPFRNLLLVWILTHIFSMIIIRLKKKHNHWIL